MLDLNQHPVLLVMMIAVVAPLLAEIPIGFRVPESVLQKSAAQASDRDSR